VEMKEVAVDPTIVGFPDDLSLPREEIAALEALHRLLATVEVVDGISYARQAALKKRRQHLLKILWAFGHLGEPGEEGGPHLAIDSETYLAQKIQSNYSTVMDYFRALEGYGVHCEHVPSSEEGWLTPGGALRKGGWFIRLSFDERAGGVSALEALRAYAARLDERHGRSAFRYFSRADMRALR
jgi:hypothetical protein